MFYEYNNAKIYYLLKREDEGIVDVFLHGWQRSGEDFKSILAGKKNYLIVDFPPFGKSGDIIGWNIFTYVNMLISLIESLKLEKVNLIGHSFGGRVAIILASIKREKVNKLVLIDSAGVKPRKQLKKIFKIGIYKLKRKLGLNITRYGSEDYKKLDENMKKTFNSIVSTYLEDYAKLIESKTLIIYGENDRETPVYMAKKLNRLIKNSCLEIVKDAGHFCFIDNKIKVTKMIDKFILEG